MKTKMVAFIALAMLLALVVTPVYADEAPSLPHAFYGTVDINGSAAPVGTEVSARGEGVTTGVAQNPIETTVDGEYGGGDDPLEPKLIVWGSIADGATVTFYVNGFSTGQTATWHSGEVTEIDLAVSIEDGAVPDEPDDSTTSDTGGSTTPPDTGGSTPPDTGGSTPPDTGGSTPPDTGGSNPPDSTVSGSDEASPGTGPLVPPPPSAGVGGVPVLWLVIGGVVFIGLIIAFWVARSRAY